MVKRVTHKQFKTLIKAYYKQRRADGGKIPLLTFGTFGVGKSAVVRDTCKEIAEKKGKNFVDWNKITRNEKEKIFKDPSKSFVLMDIRLSEFDSSDIKGLPDFREDRETIEWKIPHWAKLLENEDSDGILFFDELNLATPLVISSVYKILHDRIINEGKINDNWLILGCGNKDDDRAYTHELAPPVRDRGGEVELLPPSPNDWIEWALSEKLDSRIIGYISWKGENLHRVNFDDGQKFTTERGWARVHTLIQGVTDNITLDLIVGSAIGEGIAKEFVAFCKIKDDINLDAIIKDPKEVRKIKEIDQLYFVMTALAEKYKDNIIKFDSLMDISKVLDDMSKAEFVALLWRTSIRYDPDKFKKDYALKGIKNPLNDKYYKYLVG